MNFRDMKSEMLILSQMVAEWCDGGGESTIERDIILAKLRSLYEGVKFYESGVKVVDVAEQEPGDIGVNQVVPVLACDVLSVKELNVLDPLMVESAMVGASDVAVVCVELPSAETVAEQDETTIVDVPIPAAVVAADLVVEGILIVADMPQEGLFDAIAPSPSESELRRQKRNIIRSLYDDEDDDDMKVIELVDDDAEQCASLEDTCAESESVDVLAADPVHVVSELGSLLYNEQLSEASVGESDDVETTQVVIELTELTDEDSSEDEFVIEEIFTRGESVVLGDVINGNVSYLSDRVKGAGGVIRNDGAIASIRDSIGMNDKFLLVRDLFNGDAELYESTVSSLDGFESLDECLIYIVENCEWNPNADGTKLVMELIERKYI